MLASLVAGIEYYGSLVLCQIQGGTYWEVLPGIVRDVSFLNNPRPQRNDGAENDAVVQIVDLEAEIITSLKKGQ